VIQRNVEVLVDRRTTDDDIMQAYDTFANAAALKVILQGPESR
jgi:hypothetical protein